MVKQKEKVVVSNTNAPFYKRHLHPLLLFALGFLLYANTIPNNYNLDDELVTKNHKYTSKGLSALPEIFTSPYYSDEMGYSYDYRPIVHTSFAIEHQFFGESAHVSHFFNALLFALLCAILYFLLKLLLPVPDIIVLIAVGLFAAHPIHTEVVASIKNRDELLMMLFSSLSIYTYLRWYDSKYALSLVLSVVLFTLAMLSKATALPFAFLIPLSVIFFKRTPLYKYLLLSFLLAFIAVMFLGNSQLVYKLKIAALLTLANIAVYCLFYLINNWKQLISNAKLPINTTNSTISSNEEQGYKIELSTTLPTGLQLLMVIGLYMLVFLTAYSLMLSITWLAYLSLGTCAVYAMLSRNRTNIWSIIPIFFILLLLIHKYDAIYAVSANVLFLALMWAILNSNKRSRWLLLPLVVILIVQWVTISKAYAFFDFFLLAGALLKDKPKKIFSAAAGLLLVLLIGYTVFLKTTFSLPMILFSIIVLLVVIWIYKSYKPKPLFAVLLLLFSLIMAVQISRPLEHRDKYNFFKPENEMQYARANQQVGASLSKLNNINVQGPVKISIDRPLNFVETPVPLSASLKVKTATALDIFLRYAKLLVVPHPLLFYYGYKVIEPLDSFTPIVIFSLLLHLALIIIAIISIKQRPIISWAIIFYLAFMATLSNIFISIPGVIGERYLLVPSLAFCVLLAWAIVTAANYIAARSNKNLPATSVAKWITVSILVVYSFGTLYRNSLWKDDITLFSHDIKNAPESAQAHNLLAIHLVQKSFEKTDMNEQTELRKLALYHFKESNRVYPKMFNAAYDIGRAYAMLNMPDSAVAAFKYASTLDSNFYNIQLSIAEIYFSQAKYDAAVPYLQYLIRKLPDYYPSYEKLSYIMFLKKEYRQSVDLNLEAARKIPNAPEPYINIVRTFIGENKLDSARYYAAKAYNIAPQNAMAQQMVRELGVAPQ